MVSARVLRMAEFNQEGELVMSALTFSCPLSRCLTTSYSNAVKQ